MTKPHEEGLPIFDTAAGKVLGKIVGETAQTLILDCPAMVQVAFEAADNGKKALVKVRLLNMSLVGERYELERAGIRGRTYRYDKWLFELYAAYVAQLKSGKYELDLFVPAVEAATQLRDPTEQIPEKAVAVVSENATTKLPEEPNAKA